MKRPIYIVVDEPRVRRRMWSQERRVRRAANEAAQSGPVPEEFVVALPPPHPKNRNAHLPVLHVVGQLAGVVTSLTTMAVTATRL